MLIASQSTFPFPNRTVLIFRSNFGTKYFPVNREASFQKQFLVCILKFSFLKFSLLVNSNTKSKNRWALNTLKSSLLTEEQGHSSGWRACLLHSLTFPAVISSRRVVKASGTYLWGNSTSISFYLPAISSRGTCPPGLSLYPSVLLFRTERPLFQIIC